MTVLVGALRVVGRALRNYQRDHDSLRAAAIAYYGLVSFFPFVLLVGAFSSLVVGDDPGQARSFVGSLRLYLPFLHDEFWGEATSSAGSRVLPAASLVVLFVIASQVSVATERAMRIIFKADLVAVASVRHRVRAQLRAYALSSLGLLLVGATFIVRTFAAYVTSAHLRGVEVVARTLARPVAWGHAAPALSLGLLAYMVYRRVPSVPRVKWRWALLGAGVFLLGQEAAMSVFTHVLAWRSEAFASYYGAFVGLMMLVIWTYWLAACLLFGAEIVADLNGNRTAHAAGPDSA